MLHVENCKSLRWRALVPRTSHEDLKKKKPSKSCYYTRVGLVTMQKVKKIYVYTFRCLMLWIAVCLHQQGKPTADCSLFSGRLLTPRSASRNVTFTGVLYAHNMWIAMALPRTGLFYSTGLGSMVMCVIVFICLLCPDSYNPDLDSDPYGEEGNMWSFNYFFYNKRLKRIVFFTCRSVRYRSPLVKLFLCLRFMFRSLFGVLQFFLLLYFFLQYY